MEVSSNKENTGLIHTLRSPAEWPFFYGWFIVFFAVIGILASLPGQTIGVSIFTDSLIEVLRISRIELSTAYMCGTILSGLLIPRAGRAYDRLGARVLGPLAAAGLGFTLLFLSNLTLIKDFTENVSGSYHHSALFLLITISFLSLRFFGQGMLTMVSRNMAMKWFVRKRGLVNGLMGMSISLGFSSLAFGVNSLVLEIGWSEAWWYMGIFIGIFLSMFFLLFFQDEPAALGLIPDGAKAHGKGSGINHSGALLDGASLKEARKYVDFWTYSLALAFCSLTVTAISFHIISIFEMAGYTSTQAIAVFIPNSIISMIGIFLGGWISDKRRLCSLLRVLCGSQALCMIGLCFLETSYGYYSVIIGMGLSQAMFGLLIGLSWPRLFGITHLGAISGFALSATVIGSGIGPVFFSVSHTYTQSYVPVSFVCFLIALGLLVASFKSKV